MSILEQPWTVGTATAYLAVVIAIGVATARRTRTARDFYIAGQGIGVLVAGLATMSAAFSGFAFLGGPGLTYRIGLASMMICFPVGITAATLCWSLGKRLRLLAEVREIYTVPDALLARFGSRRTQGAAAVAVVLGVIGYLGAQLLALGRAIEAVFGTREVLGEASLAVAMGIGLAVILVYAVGGGMLAGVYTDVVQGGLMVAAAGGVFFYALSAGGGWSEMISSIASSERFGAEFLDPLGTVPALTAFGFWFVFSVGSLGQPQIVHKLFMLRDPRQLRWLPAVLGGSQSICILIWLGIGLAVPALVARGALPPLANPDDATPTFLLGFVPDALAGVVLAGVLAAVMSTADSLVNLGAAALVRDLPRALGRPLRNELSAGRWATVGVALGAAVFAYLYDDLIALLGTFAFGTFAAALTPALAVGLNWKRVSATAATASIVVGLGVNLGLELWSRQTLVPGPPLAAGALPSAVALAASFATLFAVTGLTGRRAAAPLPADVAAVMEV